LEQEGDMDRFIRRQNIERYGKLLEQATDESQKKLLLKLLSEEEAKQPSDSLPKER
jgi:hypothetical protein